MEIKDTKKKKKEKNPMDKGLHLKWVRVSK